MWAAMRDRRLLSARGHPDRLKGEERRGEKERKRESEGQVEEKDRKKEDEEASERRGGERNE